MWLGIELVLVLELWLGLVLGLDHCKAGVRPVVQLGLVLD
jgi:hypothetical protein